MQTVAYIHSHIHINILTRIIYIDISIQSCSLYIYPRALVPSTFIDRVIFIVYFDC